MRSTSISFRFAGGWLFAAALCTAQSAISEESVTAKLDASITFSGALQATAIVTATGARSAQYRDAFNPGGAGIASPKLFGRFLQTRKLESAPVLADIANAEPGVQIRIPIQEDDFLLPIQHRQSLQIELLPLVVPIPFREEIRFAIPADFAVRAESHLTEDRAFAHYRSDSKIDGATLVVVRELQLKQDILSGSNKAEVESFFKIVLADQQHAFILRRKSSANLTAWIRSVPPFEANKYGLRALDQREYEAARQLFEKAVDATPNHSSAWYNLGRALAALGKLDEAQKAYEKQLSIDANHPSADNNLARVQERQRHWDLAIQSRRKQLEIHPGDSTAISNLPHDLMNAGRWAEAEEAASQAVQALPNSALHRLNLSLARVCGGKAADARPEIDAALGVNPPAGMLNAAAYTLAECDKQFDLALSYIRRAIDLTKVAIASAGDGTMLSAIRSQNALGSYLDTYGWLLFKQGKVERARDLLNAAATLASRSEIYAHLAQLELKDGHSEQASVYWREATLLEPGQLSQVPSDTAAHLESVTPLSIDRVWWPISPGLPDNAAAALPSDQPSYFFLNAKADGSLRYARGLDSEDEAAKTLSRALLGITVPVVEIDGSPVPTVYFLKVVKQSDGKVLVARSLSTEAAEIAAELAPNEFPSSTSAAVGPQPGGTYKIGGGVSAPSLLHKVEPQYAVEARRARLEGTVVLSVVVGTDGKAHELKVIRSLGLGLDEAAIAAVKEWQFRPGEKEGKPVNVQATIQVNFRLLETGQKGVTSLARVEFRTLSGATRPFVAKSVFPPLSSDDGDATMTVTFDVDPQGNAIGIHVDKASDDVWASEVTAVLSHWKFIPGSAFGAPLPISCTMTFVRHD